MFALGLSLARPDKRIVVLEGDGSLCMNLGSLVTIATAAPSNFYQFILHNKMYETTGGQTLPNVDHLDLAMIARGAGISNVRRYGDLAAFDRETSGLFNCTGEMLVSCSSKKVRVTVWYPGASTSTLSPLSSRCSRRTGWTWFKIKPLLVIDHKARRDDVAPGVEKETNYQKCEEAIPNGS